MKQAFKTTLVATLAAFPWAFAAPSSEGLATVERSEMLSLDKRTSTTFVMSNYRLSDCSQNSGAELGGKGDPSDMLIMKKRLLTDPKSQFSLVLVTTSPAVRPRSRLRCMVSFITAACAFSRKETQLTPAPLIQFRHFPADVRYQVLGQCRLLRGCDYLLC